jgi:hypothetical protein
MKAKLGLWSDPHPVQLQDFRHGTNSPLLCGAQRVSQKQRTNERHRRREREKPHIRVAWMPLLFEHLAC